MSSKYTVLQQPVETLLSWIKSGEIAIPEIQRPFVWKSAKVRDLIDSLYKGFPVGYIITWKNNDVKLKDGSLSAGKKILIDGQQRITALTAAVIGKRVLNDEYKEINIKIAFHPFPEEGKSHFEVLNKAIENNTEWINDISPILNGEMSISAARRAYLSVNPEADEDKVEEKLESLKRISNQQIGIIELDALLDIDIVTEIFIRINQKGVKLSNADFVMSKIASDEAHNGNKMRRMIDYFCRLIVDKSFHKHIIDNDKEFAAHEYYKTIQWMKDGRDDLYRPDYLDVLRVALTYQFNRGKFSDLVALLSGRNFELRTNEEEIVVESYQKLEAGLLAFFNKTNYQRFIMIVESAGFIKSQMLISKNSLNFSYALFLKLKDAGYSEAMTQKYVKRWLVFSLLVGRYSGSAESWIDGDIKQINEKRIENVLTEIESAILGDSYFEFGLVTHLESSSKSNNGYNVYLAAQCLQGTRAFLSKSMTIKTLMENRGDEHHIFPKKYLEKNGKVQKEYNQVANYVFTEQNTNIRIKDHAPQLYFGRIKDAISNKSIELGTIDSHEDLIQNLIENDIPESVINRDHTTYAEFLQERRQLMSQRIKKYYYNL
ncbi:MULTISPECIES: GmrSD restriction endonuclease domain-containing protein [Sphingobacterium]|uniref:GmrSD restriction endonuclease domain-containing protein n=1 Tax=Sphingobacterium TaxID=28453 RepID=UPI00129C8BD4|nr:MULTISPECIES: DUF262 domain-containing protein [Sphingobacterium]